MFTTPCVNTICILPLTRQPYLYIFKADTNLAIFEIGHPYGSAWLTEISNSRLYDIMMTSSNGNISALLALYVGNSPVTGEFPTQRPVTWSFDVVFDLRMNKRLSKQSWGWWFETPSRSLWRHCNVSNWSGEYIILSQDHALHRHLTIISILFPSKFETDHYCYLILNNDNNKAAWPLSSSASSFFINQWFQYIFDLLTSANYRNVHREPK